MNFGYKTPLRAGTALGALLLALGTCGAALAADEKAEAQASDQAAEATAGGDAATSEIVVTGSKLGSRLDRAPVSVTALDAAALERENIRTVEGIAIRTPSLSYDSPTNFAQAYIRGIGSLFLLSGLESSVATYVDGAYVQRQQGASLDVVDVKSISVLKGPQGTLYGRNATGGAILLETNDPVDDFRARFGMSFGRFNDATADAMLNLPLSDVFQVRVAGQVKNREGFINNTGVVNGKKAGVSQSEFLRTKLRFAPGDSFDAVYTFEYSNRRSNGYTSQMRVDAPLCAACVAYGIDPENDSFYDGTSGPNPLNTVKSYLHHLKMNLYLGDVTVSSVTANRSLNSWAYNEQDITSAPFANAIVNEKGPTFTQDIFARTNFTSPLNVLVGGSYERDRGTLNTNLVGLAYSGVLNGVPFGNITGRNKVSLNSYSLYGELYWQIIEGVKLTAGARYNIDEKTIRGENSPEALALFGSLGAALPATYTTSAKFKNWTPRVVLSYETGDHYFYASASRGVKSGGFSTPSFAPPNVIGDETLDNFEIGYKGRLTPDLRVQAAAFYGKFKDIQVSRVGLAGVETQNAAKATIKGIELDMQWKVSSTFDMSAGATYLDNTFDEYPAAAIVVVGNGFPVLANAAADLSGYPLPRSPKLSAYANLHHRAPLTENGWLSDLSVTGKYTSRYDFYAARGGELGLDYQDRLVLVNGAASLISPDETFEIGIYGDNLLGKKYFVTAATTTFGAQYTAALPRTFGIRASKKF
ncbi:MULTISPECIES: TonB-dependent receptor [Sphingobium]|uniref:TonB-dependent receptor n=1 Tax=Sphingobium sp. MI1205 TaxID=407020 RepID=UPI00077061E1|nr:TonB-dependent receptor [Sphingobium sp. MI1205]AMK19963.1 TonB-dependent receptor [Sphingobium sp. MI1205]